MITELREQLEESRSDLQVLSTYVNKQFSNAEKKSPTHSNPCSQTLNSSRNSQMAKPLGAGLVKEIARPSPRSKPLENNKNINMSPSSKVDKSAKTIIQGFHKQSKSPFK